MVLRGDSRRRRRNAGPPWGLLLVLAALALGAYVLIQTRLGNALSLIPVAATPAPTPTATRSVESFAREADDIRDTGNYRKALPIYEQALRRKPNDIPLQFQIVRLLVFSGQASKAESRALKMVQLAPRDALARAGLCLVQDWLGKVSEALASCREAVALDPANSTAQAYLAEALADNANYTEAVKTARTAVELDPQNVDAYRNLGYAYEMATNYSQAVVYYERALQINPNLPHVLLALGRVYAALGVGTKAIFYFDQAISVDPLYAEAWERKGATHAVLGEADKALEALNKAIEIDPTRYTAFARRGEANFNARLYENAIVDYTRAVTTAQALSQTITANDYIFYGFAYFNVSADNCPQAVEAWRKALTLMPASDYVQEYTASGFRKCKVAR